MRLPPARLRQQLPAAYGDPVGLSPCLDLEIGSTGRRRLLLTAAIEKRRNLEGIVFHDASPQTARYSAELSFGRAWR